MFVIKSLRIITCSLLLGSLGTQAATCELTVSAAASLSGAFKAIASQFEQSQPCKVILNFAASGVLVQQMRHGAPVDVLATADQQSMDLAAQYALIDPKSRQDFIGNTLVLIAPATKQQPQATTSDKAEAPPLKSGETAVLQQLTDAAIQRIAIGNPASVPAGRYARDGLQHSGLWQQLSPKLVLATNVRQVLDYVVRAEVEAGFVYASDAKGQPMRQLGTVPLQSSIRYPMAQARQGTNPAAALAFIRFVQSPPAQHILSAHGFSPLNTEQPDANNNKQ